MALVWFITGVSSGLGTEIALAALKAGHKVIGTIRDRQRASDAVESIEKAGGKCLQLDVLDAAACSTVFKEAEKIHGRIDVLCNNAGLSWLGPVEDFTDAEAKEQLDLCFHAPARLIKAALPGFRARKSGTIINISSIAGIDGLPACGFYAASKFAMEGYSESLAQEVEPYNIRVLVVEPGAFRTNFLSAFKTPAALDAEPYPAAQATFEKFKQFAGKQPGDAVKAAARIVDAAEGKGIYQVKGKASRLPLGPDCVGRFEAKIEYLKENLEAVRPVAMSTNHE